MTSRLVGFLCCTLSCLVLGGAAAAAGEQTPASAAGVAVAAAADARFAMADMVAQFAQEHPEIAVTVTYGSSGNFFSQLSNGAPFDVFLSADTDFPRRLAAAGLTLAGSEFVYAVGRIVLWVPRGSSLDVQRLGMTSLADGSVRHIAIANPEHAPYGRAAEAAMQSVGLYDTVKTRLIFGENVAQAAQFVQSGSADIGIIALALAAAPAMQREGRYWEVPAETYPRMEQGGIIMKWARDVEAARTFCAFLRSPRGRATLERYGLVLPAE